MAAGSEQPSCPPLPPHYSANRSGVRERERRRGALLVARRLRLRPSPPSFAIAERRAEYAGAVIGWSAGSLQRA